MASDPADRVALMAIHPRHAEAILDGRKTVELRKRGLATDVRTVVIYATSPVQRIVGAFDVADTIRDLPKRLWARVRGSACIDQAEFDRYYDGSGEAVAFVVDKPRRLAACALSSLQPSPAVPQSFVYLPGEMLRQLDTDHREA